MKTFYQYAAFAAAALAGLCGCSSDDDTSAEVSSATVLPQPQIVVSELTTTGFTLRWERVNGAGSYLYTFNGGEETSIAENRIVFSDLEKQKEYVVAVKSCPKYTDEFKESPYTYIHVVTDELERLPAPKITLGSAYASKTVISWTEVPETDVYEYTIGGKTATTSERTVALSGLQKGVSYTFTVRAMTADATRFTNSEPAEMTFETSADDVPTIIIAPTEIISDAVAFEIHAPSDVTYYYQLLPASTFVKYDPEVLMTTLRDLVVEEAKAQGINFQLAMASMLSSGVKSFQRLQLTPELSYVILAFGLDLDGNITTELCSTRFRTTADGYSAGPNYGGSDWFEQRFYLSTSPPSYNPTNSIFIYWIGRDVVDLRYLSVPTATFLQAFPDPYDTKTIAEVLMQMGKQLDPALLPLTVNTSSGLTNITNATSGTSYTLFTLATSSTGDQTVYVNSTTTKTSADAATWFLARAIVDDYYGPTDNTVAGIMQGVDVVSVRYGLFQKSSLAGIPEKNYAAVVEQFGHDIKEEAIPYINDNGYGILFGGETIEPETSYVFIATATNSVGDKVTRWGTATTTAAPAAAPAKVSARSRAAETTGLGVSPVGEPLSDPDKFFFTPETIRIASDTENEEDLRTIIQKHSHK